jgi:hypothetical protein
MKNKTGTVNWKVEEVMVRDEDVMNGGTGAIDKSER